MTPHTVTLTFEEIILGAMQGVLRRVKAIKYDRQDNINGRTSDRDFDAWDVDIEGALGEMAFAKYAQAYWSGAAGFQQGDVGDIEIRTTRYRDGSLLLYKSSEDDRVFVLMVGSAGTYRVAGWKTGSAGKQERYWREVKKGSGRMAFMIPQAQLHPPEELP